MVRGRRKIGSQNSCAGRSGGDELGSVPGLIPDYVLEPVDIAMSLTEAQREERFDDRVLQLESEQRQRSSSLLHMRALADVEWRLYAGAPRSWRRARARSRDWQRHLFSETQTNVALRRRILELQDVMERGGLLARRAAMAAYELAEWRAERELGGSARAHKAHRERMRKQAREPNPARTQRALEHDRWRELASSRPLKGINERARWVAEQAGCPDRWRTVKDFLRREREREEADE